MPQKSTCKPGAITSGTVLPSAAISCCLVGFQGVAMIIFLWSKLLVCDGSWSFQRGGFRAASANEQFALHRFYSIANRFCCEALFFATRSTTVTCKRYRPEGNPLSEISAA